MKSNRWYTIVCMIIILFSVHGCSDSPEEPQLDTYRSTTSEYSDFYDNYNSDEDGKECIEPENPYDEFTEEGHYAGFERAEKSGGVCGGSYSDSFDEGCEEYYAQEEAYEDCLDGQ